MNEVVWKNMSNIAKISVEKHDTKEQFLYDLDKGKTLNEIICDVCAKAGLPVSHVYGLKIVRTKENPFFNQYLSESNYKKIQHSACLKICFSIEYLLNHRILHHLEINNNEENLPEREIAYDDLFKLSVDPIFIEELVKSDKHLNVLEAYVKNPKVKNKELLALLMTVCHLFQKNYVTNTDLNIAKRTVNVLKNPENNEEHFKYAISILQKILMQKEEQFLPWKHMIIKEVRVNELTPYIWCETSTSLQYCVLLLINTYLRLCKGEQKLQIIKEMNLKQNRDNIYKHIICKSDIDKNMEHELYVLQTYLLSLYNEALNTELNVNDNNIVKRDEFELCQEDFRRLTFLMDFDDSSDITNNNNYSMKSNSVENLLTLNNYQHERLSLASIISDKSLMSTSRQTSFCMDFENTTINYLTLEALRHFKKYHYKTFYQSQVEEKVYEPGIFVTSEKVVEMIAKLLHIGRDPPDPKGTFYQPIVFNCSSRTPFFLELFSRSMWLLSRTRREMKVSTIEDYPKVMKVLQKQIKMALEQRPNDFKTLTSLMSEITFDVVLERWQREKQDEMNQMLAQHPCILELKANFSLENEKFVRENRLNLLKNGAHFPNVTEKKLSGSMFVQLTKNERELVVYTVSDTKKKDKEIDRRIKVSDITHVATGQNCKHHNLCKSPSLVFSIILSDQQNQINFIAKDHRSASYWTDAFNILTGLNKRSELYVRELEQLVQMDVRLKLLELQDVSIPKTPPSLPKSLPNDLKPPVPPKPKSLIRYSRH